jgi:CheY-like chemotaxis protein
VADTGVGIPEHHLQKIFDPYFTTKHHGSGLGLATCYSIIKKHGGEIRGTSIVGKGSAFQITLPAAEGGRASEPGSRVDISRGRGRILVMDDEEPVREVAQAVLEEFGYTVEGVGNGSEAVELYRQRKEQGTPFDAVILDLTIPGGVGGKEAMEKLLDIDPDVRGIVSSGYSTDPVMATYREYGFRAVLTKPYRPQEMGKVVRELLE